MGKNTEEEHNPPATDGAAAAESNARRSSCSTCCCCCCRGWISRFVSLKCVMVLAFSAAVFLSALFWLPPFLGLTDRKDLDLDPRFKDHKIVASFNVEQSVSFLEENMLQLENDIFNEIGFPTTKVVVLCLERLGNSNRTRVVFGVDPEKKNSKISPEIKSLIRAEFETLVIKQLSFRLTEPLFGQPFLFEVLKFPGGITVIPPQPIFPLQKAQLLFNFTLNFSIYQIQSNFYELTSQLKKGINLAPYENLYITLSNSRGSTVASPTVVESSVLLTFGNTPSRLKQLAQTITGSHSGNLGLNHTVFGKVKQVRLSSFLQHSLNGGKGSAPAPAPQPDPHHFNHHHHRHHRHHQNSFLSPRLAPEPSSANKGFSPAPAPASTKRSHIPRKSGYANPPCHFRYRRPSSAPKLSPHHSGASTPTHSPAPSPAPMHHSVPDSSPLPNVVFANIQPPSRTDPETQRPHETPTISPPPSQHSSAHIVWTGKWGSLIIVLAAVLCL